MSKGLILKTMTEAKNMSYPKSGDEKAVTLLNNCFEEILVGIILIITIFYANYISAFIAAISIFTLILKSIFSIKSRIGFQAKISIFTMLVIASIAIF